MSSVSSLSGVSQFLSDLTSEAPPSQTSRRDHCTVLPDFLTTEIHPNESVSQVSSEEQSIPSEEVSLISRAEKDELKWKAKRLDAITRELRAIQLGSKAGLSTATLRDILGLDSFSTPVETSNRVIASPHSTTMSLVSLATSAAIPALLTVTLVTLSLQAASPTSSFPPLRLLHSFITSTSSRAPSTATVIYRGAKPLARFSPHDMSFLVPFLVAGTAIVGWNVLCQELGIEFGLFGKGGIVGKVFGGDDGWDIDWDGVREFFGMVEGM